MPEHSGIDDMEQEIERLKGALKMATSVCHEMKQPLMVTISIPFTSIQDNVKRRGRIKWLNDEGFAVEFI